MTERPRPSNTMFDNLRFRLLASYLAVVLVTVALAGAAFFALLGGYQERLSSATLRQVAVPVTFQLSQVRRSTDIRPLLVYLRDQASGAGVGAVIVDSGGRVVVDANPDLPQLLGQQFALPPLDTLPRQIDQLYRGSLQTEDETLDFVTIPLPLVIAETDQQTALVLFLPRKSAAQLIRDDLAPRLLLAALAGLGMALVVGVILGRWIYRPLARLRKAASDVAAGDFTTKVDEFGPRETRELAADFNRMTSEVAAGRAALRDFLIDTSHELRTPLTSVRGFSQALIDGTIVDDGERVRAAEIIQRETNRLLRLVNELSDLARLESGEVELKRSRLNIGGVITEAAEAFGPLADAAGVALHTEIEPDLPPVVADHDRLEQVLANLMDNALRHTPSSGQITLTARRSDGGGVEASVLDTGAGIPPGEMDKVFDRFYRGSRGNSGLGLTISRELVRAHGGDIRVESVEGLGARFSFTLPLATEAGEAAPTSA